ncbi:hypothetical protein [Segeticoccus rhizosphaerae]|uniref:hypothetical protein n=1 Tax=Segeticoccus rhizosphaerae TaxID=1104777 RepID=UPI0010C03659|nr:hypothetical protein [Ornithinicoccus soli]
MDAAHAGMDFLLEALPELAGEVFASPAHLLSLDLDLDLVFVETRPAALVGKSGGCEGVE